MNNPCISCIHLEPNLGSSSSSCGLNKKLKLKCEQTGNRYYQNKKEYIEQKTNDKIFISFEETHLAIGTMVIVMININGTSRPATINEVNQLLF